MFIESRQSNNYIGLYGKNGLQKTEPGEEPTSIHRMKYIIFDLAGVVIAAFVSLRS